MVVGEWDKKVKSSDVRSMGWGNGAMHFKVLLALPIVQLQYGNDNAHHTMDKNLQLGSL